MTDVDWWIALEAFRACLPARGARARNDLLFLEALRYFSVHNIPEAFGKILHRGWARIEQAIGKLKRFKRIVLRCEKTKQNFGFFVAIAAAFVLAKSVHTT